MLFLTVFILLCAGCGVKLRKNANNLIDSIKNRIDRIKREQENSEMKKLWFMNFNNFIIYLITWQSIWKNIL